jgi:hypothetical protein
VEGAVALPQKDGNRVGDGDGDGEVWVTVAVEICADAQTGLEPPTE